MRALVCFVLAACSTGLAWGAIVGPPKEPPADSRADRIGQHVEEIGQSPHRYSVGFRGTVDGRMTRPPIGYAAVKHGWQPNRSVLIENVGPGEVRNPRIEVNGKRQWHSLASIVAEATRGRTSDADRARAVWEFQRRQRFHACTWDGEDSDAVKALCVYGYTLCGNEAVIINDLWRAAGLVTRRGRPVGHCVTEVFYDGAWHLLDSDEHVICLARDNRTIVGEQQVVADHDLLKRTHTYGITSPESRQTDEFSASLYGYEGQREGTWPTQCRHTMELVLRPRESLELRWDHVGKQYSAGTALKPGQPMKDGMGDLLAGWGPQAYESLANGKLRYRPDLAHAEKSDNVRAGRGRIVAADAARPAAVTWRMTSPWVFVGGRASARVTLPEKAAAEWRFSVDGKKWQTVARLAVVGPGELVAVLDEVISPRRRPDYAYRMQLVLQGSAAAEDVYFESDVQTALLSLPELEVGTNELNYTDDGPPGRQVRVTHRWMERTTWHPPAAPAAAIEPADGQAVEGTQVAFRWTPAVDPDGDAIVDYHFELSEYADMRWPLSPNFEKLISNTDWSGKAEWRVSQAGLLNPETTYYWRVRACDTKGVWGPWSRAFHFRAVAPGVPLDVRLASNDQGYVLHWRPNPHGRPPVAYKVYGSDERGFTASDDPYLVVRGKGFVRSMEEFEHKPDNSPDCGNAKTPANLIGRFTADSLTVVGHGVNVPNTNRAYYRIVAIDEKGNPSGASDMAEVPRPCLVGRPPQGRAGQAYRWELQAVRSIGDLRCRATRTSSYNAAFWDRDVLSFTAIRIPDGLTLDPMTGLVSGTPRAAGTFPLEIKVTDQSGKARAFSYELRIR